VMVLRGADITAAATRLLENKLKPHHPPDKH
jgi:hypothetical protein